MEKVEMPLSSGSRAKRGQKSECETVLQNFEQHSRRSPDALAIYQGATALSYAALDRESTRLAWKLGALGIGPEQVIALALPRCPELIVAALATWKSGAGYLPLDPSYPSDRLAFMLKDAGAKIVLTHSRFGSPASFPGTLVIAIDSFADPNFQDTVALRGPISATNLAYVIYTSGSTGQPKGVAVEHASLLNLVRWHQKTYHLSGEDRCTWLASPGFDASVWEIWSCLASGCGLFIPEPDLILAPQKLLRWMEQQEISVSFMPTPLAEAVLQEPGWDRVSLRALLTGGDALQRRPPRGAKYEFYNHYGPTEGAVVATACRISSRGNGLPLIGKPISNVDVYLLDEQLQPVSPGEIGEICLSGAGLARGYLNQPSLTAEKFIPDQASGHYGSRLYRTGDFGRRHKDGALEFMGRIDCQVKIRGVRIELGEIEAALKAEPRLRDSCVKVWVDGADKKLVAYTVPRQRPGPASSEIAAWLRHRLPEVMVPSVFVSMSDLPLTPNDKLDRRALPPPDAIPVSCPSRIAPARNADEEMILEIWSSILRVPCGIHDSFFDLGGHSISAMQILTRIQDAFGVDLTVQSLFEAPTVAEFARQVARGQRSESVPLIPRQNHEQQVPLSFSQQQFWILDQIDPGNPFYNEQVTIHLTGRLSVTALASALNEIIRRHEVLRTCFASEGGLPIAKPSIAWAGLLQTDVESKPEQEQQSEMARVRREEALRVFNLTDGPIFRTLLVRRTEREHWLIATFHHAIFDGWSVRVFLDEISALYSLLVAGQSLPAAFPPVQYSDYACWQRSWLSEPERLRQVAFWRQQLDGLSPLELPTDRPRPSMPTYEAGRCTFAFGREFSRQLAQLAHQEKATYFMILVAAWSSLLGHWCREDDVCLATAVSGRSRRELENLIGCFTNTLLLRVDTERKSSFRELLQQVRRTALNAFAHQEIPFESVVQKLSPEREVGKNPLSQVALVFQPNPPVLRVSSGDLILETLEDLAERVRFDLELHAWEKDAALEGRLLFRTELFDERTALELLHTLEHFLKNAVRRPDDAIENILPGTETKPERKPLRRACINGSGIDLDQVESVIMRDPGVFDCAVLPRGNGQDPPELVAYLVGSANLNLKDLPSRLAFGLPEAAVPSFFIPVSSIPLTPSGRLDHQALASLPLIDSDLLLRAETALKRIPGVSQAAVVARKGRTASPLLHLADLLPQWNRNTTEQSAAAAAEKSVPCLKTEEQRPLAVSHGISLHLSEALPSTLAAALQRAASKSPEKGIRYIDNQGHERKLAYPGLLKRAEQLLAGLQCTGLGKGDEVLLQLPDNLDFLVSFWACQLGGMVPVPLSIAPSYTADNAVVQKLRSAWMLLKRPLVLTDQTLKPRIDSVANDLTGSRVAAIEELAASDSQGKPAAGHSDDLALLLLTSGSTGKPKAVMHSHRTLLTRSAAEVQWNEFSRNDISLNWLPLDHVASLVQFHIRDVYLGCDEIQVATERVLSHPLTWLDLISDFRASVTWAPNFAFALINECAADASEKAWDLSSMRNLLDGGEAIVPKTARRFLELLEPHGLPPTALHPVWGMSETAAGVTSSKRFSLATTGPEDSLVDVGEPLPGVSFRIVDAQDQPLREGIAGRLQVKGDTVTLGYFDAPEQTKDSFTQDDWFKTGDLGLLRDGRLTITGREKNVIIIHGVNYYSHEIESAVEEVQGVQVSYTAALAVRRPDSDTDELAIFFSLDPLAEPHLAKVINEIRERITRQFGISPSYLLPVAADEIPKTGIGKIQHAELRQRLERGDFSDLVKRVDLLTANTNTLPGWFFRQIWRRREPNASGDFVRNWIILLDTDGLGNELASSIKASGGTCITVRAGADFCRIGPSAFEINPPDPQGYLQLLHTLATEGFTVDGILHLWSYGEQPPTQAARPAQSEIQRGVCGLLLLIQAMAAANPDHKTMRLLVVSSQTQAVRAADPLVCERAAALGLLKTAGQELPWLSCRHIDIPGKDPQTEAKWVLLETRTHKMEPEAAYRAGRRYVARLEKIDFTQEKQKKISLRQGGRYLVTGGLGGVGIVLSAFLLKEYKAHLLIVGRTKMPDLRRRDHASDRFGNLLDLQKLGGEVAYEPADVCDAALMHEVLSRAEERWGAPLDGVFHLAAAAHEESLIDETPQGLASALAPKLSGTWALHRVLGDRLGTLFVTFSSVNGFFGGASVGSYAAANSFLDAFCHFQRHQSGLASRCLAFSLWDEVGISRGSKTKALARSKGYHAIAPYQGINSLLVALSHDIPALLVGLDESKQEIARHVETVQCAMARLCGFYTGSTLVPQENLATIRVPDRFGNSALCEFVRLNSMPLTEAGEIDRCALFASIAPEQRVSATRTTPSRPIERELAAVWKELLGLPEIYLEDSFFDLGGHSLLAAQMLARVRERLSLELKLLDLFQAPTLGSFSDLALRRQQTDDAGDLEDLVAEIEHLSSDEIRAALAQHETSSGKAGAK
jgi:amino acid adenylation domain-containing protein